MLVLSREGRVLYRWRSVPSRKNVGCAMVRPTAEHVWTSVQAALAEAPDSADVAYDEQAEMDSPSISWPIFASLLIANGWFLHPQAFAEKDNRSSPLARIKIAALRLGVFVVLWVAAFAALPTLPVAAVLAGWIAWINPKIRWLNREFQDLSGS